MAQRASWPARLPQRDSPANSCGLEEEGAEEREEEEEQDEEKEEEQDTEERDKEEEEQEEAGIKKMAARSKRSAL